MWEKVLIVKAHVPGLDGVICGFPRGGLILVLGMLGFGKTIFGVSYIYYGAVDAQEPGLYISMFESREGFLTSQMGSAWIFEGLMDNRAGGVSSASDEFGDRSDICCEHDY